MGDSRRIRSGFPLILTICVGSTTGACTRASGSSGSATRPVVPAAATSGVTDGARVPSAVPEGFTLELVDTVVFEVGAQFAAIGDRPLGGLSGISLGSQPDELVAVSDEKDAPRLVSLRVRLSDGRLDVAPSGSRVLDVSRDRHGEMPISDFEGLVRRSDSHWFVSSEGEVSSQPEVPPAVLHFDAVGRLVDELPIPDRYRPTPDRPQRRGVRPNEGFEGLSMSADGERLFVGTEGVLAQDGDPVSFAAGGLVRIMEYARRSGRYEPRREYAYPLDRVPLPEGYVQPQGVNGLSELLALPDSSLLVLERAFVRERGGARRSQNSIRLYQVTLAGAEDTSRLRSFRARPPGRVLVKRLVLDMASIADRLPQELARLENFEGMTFGPRLPDGSATVLLVSDDNFSRNQRTAFVLLKIR